MAYKNKNISSIWIVPDSLPWVSFLAELDIVEQSPLARLTSSSRRIRTANDMNKSLTLQSLRFRL